MYCVIDLETTGLSANTDSIIEFACVRLDENFQEMDTFHSLINPEREIPELISQITSITQKDVETAPTFSQVRDELEDYIQDQIIVGHNILFDIRFLESHGVSIANHPHIDTFHFANFLNFRNKSLNLGFLCQVYDIDLQNAHRAIDDALATSKLFVELINAYKEVYIKHSIIFDNIVPRLQFGGLKDILMSVSKKKEVRISDEEVIKYYIDNIDKKNVSGVKKKHTCQGVDIDDFLSTEKKFEQREGQKSMLDLVDKSFKNASKTVIEAPTGIGKTYAYLLPAIKYSLELGHTVHVSTSTKVLQDQIYYKDLNFLAKNLGYDFSYSKLKGKRNYVSIHNFLEFVFAKDALTSSEFSFVSKIFLWSQESALGELEEIEFYGEEYQFVSEIHAGFGNTLSDDNEYKEREFLVRARENAKKSNLVITNNHILFQDTISEGALSGGITHLILDEGHSLEDVVTSSLKKSLSYNYLETIVGRLENRIKGQIRQGKALEQMNSQKILFHAGELFSLLESFIYEKFSLNDRYKKLLLKEGFFKENPQIQLLTQSLLQEIEEVSEFCKKNKIADDAHSYGILGDIQKFSTDLEQLIIQHDFSQNIYYLQQDEGRCLELISTVLYPGKFLQENLWEKLETVVLTSATLQMDGDFSYIDMMLCLESFEKHIFSSPFDYEKQALVFIPQDLGSIKYNLQDVIGFLKKFYEKVGGNTLTLFSSFANIKELYAQCKTQLSSGGIQLLAQGVSGGKHKLLESFKSNSNTSILLGTDSLWEGVDIPGEDLQYLIIHKIPFHVPSDPIFMARGKLFKDSFQEYAIPKSIIKLRQGVGRLIRTKTDTGVIVFLDDRIYSTQWGKKYLSCFPENIKIRYGTTEKLLSILP